ncbi:TPA: hypothetical protein HA361_00380 [Candidatus Woesearchaeota archaeon]|nr:hypothetical protein [Candidatus Woesearchaeota archaeon]
MKTIKESLLQIAELTRKRKGTMLLLLLIQTIFFVLFVGVGFHYGPAIAAEMAEIIAYAQSEDFNPEVVAFNLAEERQVMGSDPELIGRNFSLIRVQAQSMLLLLAAIYLVLGGLNWSLAQSLIFEQKKAVHRYFIRFAVVCAVYVGIIYAIGAGIFRNISLTSFGLVHLVVIAAIALLLLYLMAISFAHLRKTLKGIALLTIPFSVRKIGTMLVVILINTLVVVLLAGLVVLAADLHIAISIMGLVLLNAGILYARLFFIESVRMLS